MGALAVALGGCESNLGTCDDWMAREVVLQEAGPPAFKGQALVEVSCASTFCHTPEAVGEARKAAPAGLDFHVSVACTGGQSCSPEDIDRLRRNQRRVVSWAGRILRTVEKGDMPPGAEGRSVVDSNRSAFAYEDLAGDPLPPIDSSEGKEILRNWLACGAPVVERSEPPGDEVPGTPCNDGSETVGDCIVEGESCELMPTWTSVYDCVVRPLCVQCHGPEQPEFLEASALDLSSPAVAFSALVDAPGAGDECNGAGTLVVPGDPDASILIAKLEVRHDPGIEVCGDGMPTPPISAVPQAHIDVIRQWIAAGALDD
jgi:hypothetical protein